MIKIVESQASFIKYMQEQMARPPLPVNIRPVTHAEWLQVQLATVRTSEGKERVKR